MNPRVVLLAAAAALVLLLAGFSAAVLMFSWFGSTPFALARTAPGYYGPGMMQGGMMQDGRMGPGMMQGGMMQGGRMGPGMMQGGMMGRGMMGGYGYGENPAAPGSATRIPQTAAPASTPANPRSTNDAAPTATAPAAAPSGGRGRGMMGGGQPAGGLAAVTADGKAIPADPTLKLPENTAAQKVGNLNVSLALTPYPPASFQRGNLEITLTDAGGQAITDAQISLDLTMPGMWMPANKADAAHVGNGKYQASALYTMRGQWRIEVIVTRGGTKQSAFFDVWL